jgi:hypothetical protein
MGLQRITTSPNRAEHEIVLATYLLLYLYEISEGLVTAQDSKS